jgi:hypothetical protein
MRRPARLARQLEPKKAAALRAISSGETSSVRWLSIHC